MKRLSLIVVLLSLVSTVQATIYEPNDTTDVTVQVVVKDSFGDPNTTIDVTKLDLYYIKTGAAISSKVDCTLLADATTAHTDGGAFHKGYGVVRVDLPDIVFSGDPHDTIVVVLVSAGNQNVYQEIQLNPPVDVMTQESGNPLGDSADIVTAVNTSLDTAIPGSPTEGSINAHIAALSTTGVALTDSQITELMALIAAQLAFKL